MHFIAAPGVPARDDARRILRSTTTERSTSTRRSSATGRSAPGSAPTRDALAWERIVPRYQRRLARIIRRALVRGRGHAGADDVEELLQETWCRVFERGRQRLGRIHRQDGGEGSFAYVARIARNVTVDRLRREGSVKRGGGWLPAEPERSGEHPTDLLGAGGPTPEERAIHADLRRRFRERCRQGLGSRGTDAEVRALELALLEGLSSRQIAELVGGALEPDAIDLLVHRTRRVLARGGMRFGPRR